LLRCLRTGRDIACRLLRLEIVRGDVPEVPGTVILVFAPRWRLPRTFTFTVPGTSDDIAYAQAELGWHGAMSYRCQAPGTFLRRGGLRWPETVMKGWKRW
jgi:hypothetical protein